MNLVLDSKIPKNIAKSKRKRMSQLPDGPDRYNPQSTEFMEMFRRKEQEKEEKESSKMLVSSLFKQIFFEYVVFIVTGKPVTHTEHAVNAVCCIHTL